MYEDLNYREIVKLVSSYGKKGTQGIPIKIAFLRNITIDPMIQYLKYYCYQEGLNPEIFMGDYDIILQEVMNDKSDLYKFSPDLIILCIKPEILANKLFFEFTKLSNNERKEEFGRIIALINKILNGIRENSKATILLHNFEVPVYPNLGIIDYQDSSKQIYTFREINKEVLNIILNYESCYIVDINLLQSTIGYQNFIDKRYWHIGKAPYTREAYKIISLEYMKFIRALQGKNRKCLVLDCDNTLWGGIIGEEGLSKIKLGETYPGSCYKEFQKSILNLYNRGIMLSVCSKNNEKDVIEVLQNHPDMLLKKSHFVSTKINWKDKVTNLKEIAIELNIGLDSIVLMDDSEFEINLVRKLLPQVKSILLPNDPAKFSDLLNSIGLFDVLNLTEEDKKRTNMYRTEIKRKQALNNFNSEILEDYFKDLEMEILINNANEFTIPRISQLTQKTNQFNLTTKRYSEVEIKRFCQSDEYNAFSLHLKDRFGDMGIVGVAIVKFKDVVSIIDTFLLSCRVIGRGVEDILLYACIISALNRKCDKIIGVYFPTKKNIPTKEFYEIHNFSILKKNEAQITYTLNLSEKLMDFPKYFKSIKINDKEFLKN